MKRVTAIARGKGDRGRAKVFLDGGLALSLELSTIEEDGLRAGLELSEAQVLELVRRDMVRSALNASLRFLSYRPRSEEEVRKKLYRLGAEGGVVEEVILKLKQDGVLDDASFAKFWRESRESFSPRGRRLLERELLQKGVDPETVKETTKGLYDEESAYRAGLKKAKALGKLEYKAFRNKLGAFLIRRGFNYSVVQSTVQRLWQEGGCPEGSS